VGKKTALLQAEASACVLELVNVLFCGVAVSFYLFSQTAKLLLTLHFGLLPTVMYMESCVFVCEDFPKENQT
tara:strand:- start:22455 stop:22670 length:216 start_codon:yes stop_codon:yes gene_type:complete